MVPLSRRSFVIAIFIGFATSIPCRCSVTSVWDPKETYVLVASIIEWPAKAGLSPFNTERRRDQDLVDQFRKSGVPATNIVFLKDSQATHAAICRALSLLAARAGPKSTLVFYFQGHGSRKRFCCYDTDTKKPDETELQAEEIFPILEKSWKGDRLFLIGDCCSSGSLATVVRQYEAQRPEVHAICLASATASNISTYHWTFTASLIRVLAGDPKVDRNGDGKITLEEAAQFLHDQMKFQENQLAGIRFTPASEKDLIIRLTAPEKNAPPHVPGPHQIGDVVDARDNDGKWYASEIIGWRPTIPRYRIHFYGWGSEWDEWLGLSRLRPLTKAKLTVGQLYEVQWEDQNWYLGTITKSVEAWFYFVHYESEAGDDDEWITAERARRPGAATTKEKPQFVAAVPRPVAIGDTVAAQWFRDWYRARILGNINGTWSVLYDDQTKGRLAPDDVLPIARPGEIRAGVRVLACWGDDGRMFPGKVESIKDQSVIVRWEDGTAPAPVPLNGVALIRP